MTALCAGRNRAGRGNASPETALVRAAFARFHTREGRAPSVPELLRELAARGIVVTPERVVVHLNIARLRAHAEEADHGR